jgi:hypothetical protein
MTRKRSSKICSYPECGRGHEAHGLCSGHNRQRRLGQELRPLRIRNKPPKDGLCTYPDCSIAHQAKGYCASHYLQHRLGEELRAVTPSAQYSKDMTWQQRVQFQLDNRTVRDGDCLLWTGAKTEHGYGQYKFNNQNWVVHRLSYCLSKNSLDACGAETVHHKCANRACVNPDHLELATNRENLVEMFERNAYIKTIKIQKKEISNLKQKIIQLEKEINEHQTKTSGFR